LWKTRMGSACSL